MEIDNDVGFVRQAVQQTYEVQYHLKEVNEFKKLIILTVYLSNSNWKWRVLTQKYLYLKRSFQQFPTNMTIVALKKMEYFSVDDNDTKIETQYIKLK